MQRISSFSFHVWSISCLEQHWKYKRLFHLFFHRHQETLSVFSYTFFATTTPSSCFQMKSNDRWMWRKQRKDKELISPAGEMCSKWKHLVLRCLHPRGGWSTVKANFITTKTTVCKLNQKQLQAPEKKHEYKKSLHAHWPFFFISKLPHVNLNAWKRQT